MKQFECCCWSTTSCSCSWNIATMKSGGKNLSLMLKMWKWSRFGNYQHPNTHTHTTVLRLCGFCPGQPGWAGTRRNIHPLTPILVINRPYLLSPSTTIHGILPIQSTCLTVFFHNLSPSFLWSSSWPGTPTSYSIHFFTQSLSSFRNTCPYHHNLFRCSTEIMSPSLPLNCLLGALSCNFTPHIHLTILISALGSATSFSFLTGQVSLPCNIPLHTQLLYNLIQRQNVFCCWISTVCIRYLLNSSNITVVAHCWIKCCMCLTINTTTPWLILLHHVPKNNPLIFDHNFRKWRLIF